MKSKFVAWVGMLIFLSIFSRAMYYLYYKAFVAHALVGVDWVAGPIGLVALFICYMYFRRIFTPRR